ncbi:hypothetical protein KUTeg_004793 [Tegillarca granosa]|uniref:Uncharacterized protein n=1 Tax=Tegillarca granosa TaxID=220873 RepID=A0ABQ9FHY6_TEGGR|nr:hypothetical protein KUTeg_004793 [Tegillarca granosa]
MTSTYPISATDIGLPVTLDLVQTEFDVDPAWIAGAFFLGLILGGGIIAVCAPFCIRDWEKKKRQDEEEEMLTTLKNEDIQTAEIIDDTVITATVVKKKKKMKGKGKQKGKRFTEPDISEDDEVEYDKDEAIAKIHPGHSQGMVNILIIPNGEDAEAEMTKQDVHKVDQITKEFQKEKDEAFLKLLRCRLLKLRMEDPLLSTVLTNILNDLRNKKKMYEDERNDSIQDLKLKHGKNTQTMEEEKEQIDARINQKLGRLYEDERENIRNELSKNTSLTDAEIEELMDRLLNDMSKLEKKIGDDLARQKRGLEERLAKRRQIMIFRNLQDQQNKMDPHINLDSFDKQLTTLVSDGRLVEKQKKELLEKYRLDINQINKKHEQDSLRRQQELAEKLRERRLQRLYKLQNKHEKERANYLIRVDKGVGTADFVDDYHDILQNQRAETDSIEVELDQTELQQIDQLRQDELAAKSKEIEDRNSQLMRDIADKSQISRNEMERILSLHKQQMAAYEENKAEERNRMAAKLRERWEQRMMELEVEDEKARQEQETLMEQQTATVTKVISNSLDLTEEAKEKILREHEHNMQVLNNNLAQSRLRQQKSLDQKISQRRAKMAELRRQKEEARLLKIKGQKEEIEKLQKELDEQIKEEEMKLAEERAAELAALRRKMAAETEEALCQQERDLGVLIGRLEVGRARRQAVLQKQDQMLSTLQEQLETKLTNTGGVKIDGADQIIQQHYNQVEHLNEQIQISREKQEYVIQEKIQAKKLQKELELRDQQAEEKQLVRRNSSIRRKGVSKAGLALENLFMMQKQKKQRDLLEQEMKVELERSKEELNQQLEQELESELQDQKKEFLSQLAAMSELPHRELQDAVDAAVSGYGGNKKAAKKLAKDLREGVARAKTDLGMEDDNDSDEGYRRPSSASLGPLKSPKSSAPKKKKITRPSSVAPAQEEWMVDDDF